VECSAAQRAVALGSWVRAAVSEQRADDSNVALQRGVPQR
jgi:hypothetical protein